MAKIETRQLAGHFLATLPVDVQDRLLEKAEAVARAKHALTESLWDATREIPANAIWQPYEQGILTALEVRHLLQEIVSRRQ